MKKIVLIMFLSLISFSIKAGEVGLLHLIGVVPPMLSIEVQANSQSTSLDLSASPIDLEVARIVEDSNSQTGYQILAQALNGGVLVHEQGLDQLQYSAKYNGNNMPLDGSAVKVKNNGGVFHEESIVTISYEGKDSTQMVAESYSDTITLTIIAN